MPVPPEPAPEKQRFEPWAWLAFALTAVTLLSFVYLGIRPGGRGPVWVYRQGTSWLQMANWILLALGIVWCFVRRPVLQRGRVFPLIALAVAFLCVTFPLSYPSSHEGRPSGVAFRLPVEGEWTVCWGGRHREENLLVLDPARCYGYDLMRTDEHGNWREGEKDMCFGSEVVAPADGTIVVAYGGDVDGGPRERLENHPFGNHLVLRVAADEFVVLGNLEEASLLVAEGQEVVAGRPLARVGDSARRRWTQPSHLMIHLQDTPEPGNGEGIPLLFHGFFADGERIESGVPHGGRSPYDRHPGQRIVQGRP